jgi:hypothetical protein
MKAKLKRLHSPDVDLQSFWPENPQCFSFLLQAMIGPVDSEGEESFDIEVCTPEWLRSQYSDTDVLPGRHLLIVFDYDLDRIKNYISRYCERCEADNWEGLASKLSRLGQWEFEGYSSS